MGRLRSVEDLASCAVCGRKPDPPSRETQGRSEVWHLHVCCLPALRLVYKAQQPSPKFFFEEQLALDRAREYLSPSPTKAQAIHLWNRVMGAANAGP
jgi:hypothetical protein